MQGIESQNPIPKEKVSFFTIFYRNLYINVMVDKMNILEL